MPSVVKIPWLKTKLKSKVGMAIIIFIIIISCRY